MFGVGQKSPLNSHILIFVVSLKPPLFTLTQKRRSQRIWKADTILAPTVGFWLILIISDSKQELVGGFFLLWERVALFIGATLLVVVTGGIIV